MLDPELRDLEVLELLSTKVMDAMRKEHTTPFHKRLPIWKPALGAKFLQQIYLHYDFNLELKIFMEKLPMLVSLNVSSEQKANWLKLQNTQKLGSGSSSQEHLHSSVLAQQVPLLFGGILREPALFPQKGHH